MRPIILACLSFAATLAGSAFAQPAVDQFPQPYTTTPPTQVQPLRAPSAIDDKAAGQYMYAGQLTDQGKLPGWVRFRSTDAKDFEKLASYRATTENLGAMRMGAYDTKNHKYFGLLSLEYSLGFYPQNFVEVDVATGNTSAIKAFSLNEQSRWYNGYYQYCMAYDPSSDLLYALGTGYDFDNYGNATRGYSVLYTIDEATGEAEEVWKFDVIYWNFCFDYDGNCYLLTPKPKSETDLTAVGTKMVKLNSDFDPVDSCELTTSDGQPFIMYYFGTMGFDHTNGRLYWIPVGYYGANMLYEVNPQTGRCSSVSWFMSGNSFVGLHIPFLSATSRKAPAQVSALTALPSAAGAMSDTLRWTNPSTAWDKTAITTLTGAKIYRKKAGAVTTENTPREQLLSKANAELVATLTEGVSPGTVTSWTDSHPHPGINTYYILATNAEGDGVPDSIRCFSGTDIPGAPKEVSARTEGNGLAVTWKAPDRGAHNGYINPDELSYTVTRMPDSVVVATHLTGTALTDTTIGEYYHYYYRIQASNAAGAGETAESPKVKAGRALRAPIRLAISSADEALRWTNSNGTLAWAYIGWDGCTDEYHALGASGNNSEASGYLVSPPLWLEAGKTYRVTTNLWANYKEASFDLMVGFGASDTDTTGCSRLRDDKDRWFNSYDHLEALVDTFIPTRTGVFYYYMNMATHNAYNDFRFYGLKVEALAQRDLGALSLNNLPEAVAGTPTQCSVAVRNMGLDNVASYAVRIVAADDEGSYVAGETAALPALKPGQEASVPVTITPRREGVTRFFGVVTAEGDANAANDTTSATTLTVQPAGTTPINRVVTNGKNESVDSRVPFTNYEFYERSQTIYRASEVNTPAGATIRRIGFLYDGNNLEGPSYEMDIKLRLGHSGLTAYTDTAQATPDDEMELVYDGHATLMPGNGNLLTFQLDKPFAYDGERNLVVSVDKLGYAGKHFAALWHDFADDDADSYRTCFYESRYAFQGAYRMLYPKAPILYLGLDENAPTGLRPVGTAKAGVSAVNGVLSLGEDVSHAEVYTPDGRRVAVVRRGDAAQRLAGGIYIVRARLSDGSSEVVKVHIAR